MSDNKKIDCDKRQREVRTSRKGEVEESHRCLEEKVPETYLKIVDVPTCEGCPMMVLKNNAKKLGCGADRPEWESELLAISPATPGDSLAANPAEAHLGYETQCPYRWDGVCRVTGHKINPEICKACDQETATEMAELGLVGKALKWGNAVKRWVREGRPVRSDEEVKEIFETHCKPCELYDPETHGCKKCGCAVNTDTAPLGNKLKMKTEVCPMGLWR